MNKSMGHKVVAAIVIVGGVVVAAVVGTHYYASANENRGLHESNSRAFASSPSQSQTHPKITGATSATTKAADTVPAPVATEGQGDGMAALARASAAGKYIFIFFSKEDDQNTATMRKVFEGAMGKAGGKADSIAIKITDPAEKKIVDKYRVTSAPMPLVLAVAPNGAVTGGFPRQFNENTLLGAFASPGMEKCLKALQERKLVILCAQNNRTKSNDVATKCAHDFKADARFARFTEIVRVDPADATEAKFMKQLRIEPKTTEAVTAMLAPPGVVVGTFKGAVAKDALVSALIAATSGGCGSGGCGPSGCN